MALVRLLPANKVRIQADNIQYESDGQTLNLLSQSPKHMHHLRGGIAIIFQS